MQAWWRVMGVAGLAVAALVFYLFGFWVTAVAVVVTFVAAFALTGFHGRADRSAIREMGLAAPTSPHRRGAGL